MRMERSTKKLNIPHGGDLTLNKNQDQLEIHVTQTCQWCFSDPNGIFPGILPPGQYDPGNYGPYIPVADGKVLYGDPIDKPCTPGKTETGHTITVSG